MCGLRTNYPNTFAGNAELTLDTMSAEARMLMRNGDFVVSARGFLTFAVAIPRTLGCGANLGAGTGSEELSACCSLRSRDMDTLESWNIGRGMDMKGRGSQFCTERFSLDL